MGVVLIKSARGPQNFARKARGDVIESPPQQILHPPLRTSTCDLRTSKCVSHTLLLRGVAHYFARISQWIMTGFIQFQFTPTLFSRALTLCPSLADTVVAWCLPTIAYLKNNLVGFIHNTSPFFSSQSEALSLTHTHMLLLTHFLISHCSTVHTITAQCCCLFFFSPMHSDTEAHGDPVSCC